MFKPKNTMKNYYLFFLLIASCFTVNAQENCEDASAYLGNAYSHVKDSYESNNIDHLKYYADRSLKSFKLSKENLTNCGCKTTMDLVVKAIDLLAKVETSETFEDGRFFVKRAKEISKESIVEIDKCSMSNGYDEHNLVADNTNSATTNTVVNTTDQELTALQNEELKLKQQQEALRLKQEQLKQKLAEQKEKELKLKKEQLILSYKNTLSTNLKTYNETLKVCDCEHKNLAEPAPLDNISTKSIEDIKSYYKTNLKTLASNYLSELDLCED